MTETMPRRVYSFNDIKPYDHVEITHTDKDLTTRTTFVYGGYSPAYASDLTAAGALLPNFDFSHDKVRVVGREEKQWPESGAVIIVLKTDDEMGEAGLPGAPFLAYCVGEKFYCSNAEGHCDYWHKSFAAEWRELTLQSRDGGVPRVEVSSW